MRLPFILILLIFTSLSFAATDETHYDRITLSANASMEVQQDELQASLYAMSEDDDAQTSANTVSKRIQKALKIVTDKPDITVQTGSFNTHPVYNKRQIVAWRSRQTIVLKSTDAAKLSQLLGKLQSHVQIQNIQYTISEQSRSKAEDELIKQAIQHFKDRARLITREMDRRNYRLVNMNVATNHHGGPIIRHSMAMAERASADVAPPIKPGTQRIQVTANGTIEVLLK